MQLTDLYSRPDDWQEIRIDALARPVRQLVDPAELKGETVCHISIPSFDEVGGGRLEPAASIASQKLRLQGGEVLLARLNPRKSRVLLVPPHQAPILASTEFVALRPGEACDPNFLAWALRSRLMRQWLDSQTRSVTRSHQRADSQTLTHAQLWLPPIDKQRRIAAFLDRETSRIDRLVDRKRHLLGLLDEKRKAVGRAAVSGELTSRDARRRESDLPWLPAVPSQWPIAKLSLVAKLGTGHTPSRSEPRYWEGERDIPWLTTSDIQLFRNDRRDTIDSTKESISRLGLENSSAELHPGETVALSRTASVGFSVIMGCDMATSQDFVTWTCSERLDPGFLLLCLRAMRTDLQHRLATGSTHKTIYMPVIQGLRIPLPPIEEQRRAVGVAKEQMAEVDRLAGLISQQLPLFGERRDTLVTAAVSGQVDPSSYEAPTSS
jgi:type I restriction enzyme, S subunit